MADWSQENFWDTHPAGFGALLLVGLALFPRVTLVVLWVADGLSFGVGHWLGLLFAPHLLVAILATSHYWHTNPVLCVFAWCFAFGGTGSEAGAVRERWRRRRLALRRPPSEGSPSTRHAPCDVRAE
jgi:hypothetical protein